MRADEESLVRGRAVGSLRDAGGALRAGLAEFTPARVGLRRTGVSLSTVETLRFAEAHALARDAVYAQLPVLGMVHGLREQGLDPLAVKSAARGREEYLLRPDLGRRLSEESKELLRTRAGKREGRDTRLVVVIADGLSAMAADRHGIAVMEQLLSRLGRGVAAGSGEDRGWTLGPVVVAEQARVALGDEVAEMLGADAVVVLIGERPGLSSPDSLGAYVTWAARVGTTDAERNCVSNIRPEGLGYGEAATAIAWYLKQGRRMGRTGIGITGPDGAGPARRLPDSGRS